MKGGSGFSSFALTTLGTNAWLNRYYHTFDEVLPNLPQTGSFTWDCRIYEPYTNVPAYNTQDANYNVVVDSIYYSNIRATYQPDEIDPSTEQILYADINEDENVEEIEVIHGDGTTSISQG